MRLAVQVENLPFQEAGQEDDKYPLYGEGDPILPYYRPSTVAVGRQIPPMVIRVAL